MAQPVAAVTPSRIGLTDHAFDFYGCFLDEDDVLLKTCEHELLICSGDLDSRALVTLRGYRPDSGLELASVLGTASGTFAAELAGRGTTLATVWQLAQRNS